MGGALVKTLLELSLSLKVPVVNGLCFRAVSEGDAGVRGAKLAKGAVHMSSVREGTKDTYTGERLNPIIAESCVEKFPDG